MEAVSAQDADQSEAMTTVTFWLQYHVDWGQRLRVIGSHPRLGEQWLACSRMVPSEGSLSQGPDAFLLRRAPAGALPGWYRTNGAVRK